MQGKWQKKDDGKYHYIDKNNLDIMGWISHENNPSILPFSNYYLNAEPNDIKNSDGETFKPGEMVTGKVDIKGKTYYFDPTKGPNEGKMRDTTNFITINGALTLSAIPTGFKTMRAINLTKVK
ncbi:hypothetical protein HFP66_01720 [Bacillus sp. A17A.1]